MAVLIATAAAAPAADAQKRGGSASPSELWRDYPLKPEQSAGDTAPRTAAAPAAPPSGPAAPGEEPSQRRSEGGSDDRPMAAGAVVLAGLVGGALFLAFRARRRPARQSRQAGSGNWEALKGARWTAEIQWRNDRGASRFSAVASPPGATGGVTLAESRVDEWPPRSGAAVEALTGVVGELERQLLAAGWEQAEPGSSWFAKRFVWPRADRPTDRKLEEAKAPQRA